MALALCLGTTAFTSCQKDEEFIIPIGSADTKEAVDLGLSVKWATCNLGAQNPEEYGCYYAWGETRTKTEYTWETYRYCHGTENSLTKYCTNEDYGTYDGKTVLDPKDDAASVRWLGQWRMPTAEEVGELVERCVWLWTSINGVDGYRVEGPNGNSIFLPAAGFHDYDRLDFAGVIGYYWCSSLNESIPSSAFRLFFDSDGRQDWNYAVYRYYGRTIRPVCP